ncbi:MAG TPA: TonB family protein [Terriglobales bacterium]|nr:TonB family protein [Terriglobales bacterium]
MAVSADIYLERDPWERSVALSVALHGFFFGGMLLYAALFGGFHGENWGGAGGGGALSATLVSNVPIPRPPAETEQVLANESAGLSESLPREKEQEPEAVPIPEPNAREKPVKPKPVAPPQSNVIPFGKGGPVSGPYGVFEARGAKGGFGFTGPGGDFGSRYAWYVDVVRRKVSENWLKYEVDPSIGSARRVYVTFDILRSGQPANIEVEQSSGVPSLDQSALRALKRIDTFGPLPPDYSGSKVSVEFWFDYRR